MHKALQATRAMYSLIRNTNRPSLPIDIQIDLLNKTIKSYLIYGWKYWDMVI
jgi:hypothetical protein